jgi:GNAT superfamily N-acetyltransferase
MQENLERMIKLADEFFEARTDPDQINVTPRVIAKLERIHPSTLSALTTKKGPVAWMLVIPTTTTLMTKFVEGRIGEKELLKRTPLDRSYQAIYLCSALVLPEYRGKGIARKLLAKAIKSIRRDHPIEFLFFWAFSKKGARLAVSVARTLKLPLVRRS